MAILIYRGKESNHFIEPEFLAMVDLNRHSTDLPLRYVNGIGRVALGITESSARDVAKAADLRLINGAGAHGDGLINIRDQDLVFSGPRELELYDFNGAYYPFWSLAPEIAQAAIEQTLGILYPLLVSTGLPTTAFYTPDRSIKNPTFTPLRPRL